MTLKLNCGRQRRSRPFVFDPWRAQRQRETQGLRPSAVGRYIADWDEPGNPNAASAAGEYRRITRHLVDGHVPILLSALPNPWAAPTLVDQFDRPNIHVGTTLSFSSMNRSSLNGRSPQIGTVATLGCSKLYPPIVEHGTKQIAQCRRRRNEG